MKAAIYGFVFVALRHELRRCIAAILINSLHNSKQTFSSFNTVSFELSLCRSFPASDTSIALHGRKLIVIIVNAIIISYYIISIFLWCSSYYHCPSNSNTVIVSCTITSCMLLSLYIIILVVYHCYNYSYFSLY